MKKIVVLLFLLFSIVLVSSCQQTSTFIFGVWARESNDSDSQSYLVLEKLKDNKVLVLVLNMYKPNLSKRYIGMQLSDTEISYKDIGGVDRRIKLLGENLEVKTVIMLPEYNPDYYNRVKPDEGSWK